jgi:hypothetical protein
MFEPNAKTTWKRSAAVVERALFAVEPEHGIQSRTRLASFGSGGER